MKASNPSTKREQQTESQHQDLSPKNSLHHIMKPKIGLFAQSLFKKTGFQHKTLWDVLELFGAVALPLVLFMAGQSIQEQSQIIAESQRNQEILSSYLEDMTELLLDYHLRDPQEHDPQEQQPNSANNAEVNQVARAKTLNVFRRLGNDGESKGQIIKFLYESDLIGKCRLSAADLKSTNCQPAILHLHDARLNKTIVGIQSPEHETVVNPFFPGIDLQRVELNQANLVGIDLSYAQLQYAKLRGANLSGAFLTNANLYGTYLNDANLSGAKITSATLNKVILENANLSNATLEGAKLAGAILKNSNLEHTKLQSADLSNATLEGANLDNAELQEVDLRGANLSGASLQNTDFRGAKYSATTKFPADFNLLERGMTLMD